MTVSIRVTHPSGKIDPAKYWLGFLVAHEEYADAGKICKVDSVEIVSLNLSFVEHRRVSGGFSFPIALRNDEKNRTDPTTVAAYYIQIDDLAAAFDRFKFIKYVEFVLLRRDGGQLNALGSGCAVHFHTDSGVIRAEVGDAEGRHACIHRAFAHRNDDGSWTLAVGNSWVPQPNFRGEITALCAKVRDELEQQRHAATAPAPVPVPAPTPAPVPAPVPAATPGGASVPKSRHGEGASANPVAPPAGRSKLIVGSPQGPKTGAPRPPIVETSDKKSTALETVRESGWNWQKTTAVVALVVGVIGYLVFRTPSAPSSDVVAGTGKPDATTRPQRLPPPPASALVPPVVPKAAVTPHVQAPAGEPAPAHAPVEPAQPRYPVKSREEIAQFGFDDHLKKVIQVLKATGVSDDSAYADGMAWLEANKQPPLLDPEGAASRKAFNDEAERRIVAARSMTDPLSRIELGKVVADSTEFLTNNFGSARAQLNLALTYILLNQPKASLPPAFHSIVHNPMGGNGWVALGMGLALQGDYDGGAQGLCVALKVARFSDKTVSLMQRLEAGAEYDHLSIRQAARSTRKICPSDKWN